MWGGLARENILSQADRNGPTISGLAQGPKRLGARLAAAAKHTHTHTHTQVDGVLWDLCRPLEKDCSLQVPPQPPREWAECVCVCLSVRVFLYFVV